MLPILSSHVVQDLVDQPHGIYLPGSDRAFRVVNQISRPIHPIGKHPGSIEVGKYYISA
jgi:hypothetical protein